MAFLAVLKGGSVPSRRSLEGRLFGGMEGGFQGSWRDGCFEQGRFD